MEQISLHNHFKDKTNIFYRYGYMTIPKGTILYHMNDSKKFIYKNEEEKPFLFCTFHPSEYKDQYYIHYIKLKKKIKVLVMIEKIDEDRIYSALSNISGYDPLLKILLKMNILVLHQMKDLLKKENLNGWFSSIDNGKNTEITILNKYETFIYIKSHKMIRMWRNGYLKNNEVFIKEWRNLYKISFIEKPIKLYVNKRFKKLFKKYKKYEKKSKFIHEYIFQMILDYAKIKYYK
jgi:hypothetical protein